MKSKVHLDSTSDPINRSALPSYAFCKAALTTLCARFAGWVGKLSSEAAAQVLKRPEQQAVSDAFSRRLARGPAGDIHSSLFSLSFQLACAG